MPSMTQRPDMADGSCSMPCFLSSLRRMAKASALCGASPSTPCCACCFGSWHSLLSWLLHYALPHVTTPVAVAQHVSPFQPHAANSPVCPPLPSSGTFSPCCRGHLSVFVVLFRLVVDLGVAVLSLLRAST